MTTNPPRPTPPPEPPTTADGLRHAIDSGEGRDKVPYPDPSAAPLGTDDEAAGTPVTREQVAMAARHEVRGPGGTDTAAPGVLHDRQTTQQDTDPTVQQDLAGLGARRPASGAAMSQRGLAVILAAIIVVVLLLWLW